MLYETPKGRDERRIPYPSYYTEDEIEDMKRKGIYFINWSGWAVPVGPNCTMKFLDEIKSRLNSNQSAIILISGPPGKGKSYFAIRIAEMFDSAFDVEKQVCFTRIHLLKILSGEINLKRKQAVIIDEAHISAGSRSWGKQDQQDLVNLLAAARSKGLLILIIALHEKMLDLIIRKYMGSYMIGIERPGLGTPYRLYTPRFSDKLWKSKYDPLEMELPDAETCDAPDCLACEFLYGKEKNCISTRAIYERLKKTFLDELAKTVGERIQTAQTSAERPSRSELIKQIYENHKDEIRYNTHGKIHFSCIIDIVETMGWPTGTALARTIAASLYQKHDDLRPPE